MFSSRLRLPFLRTYVSRPIQMLLLYRCALLMHHTRILHRRYGKYLRGAGRRIGSSLSVLDELRVLSRKKNDKPLLRPPPRH